MSLLREKDRQHLIKEFAALKNPVKLVIFTQEFECDYCRETRQIAEEVAELSNLITVEVHDFVADKALADKYGVDKIPATVLVRGGGEEKDYGIRYYGIPSGYEFTSLIHDILMIGTGETGLSAQTKAWVAELKSPLHLQVFVTPTCPYCPPAVLLAHKLAMESDLIRADMVEASEFPHLSMKYNVMGVPRTVINEDWHVEGAVPEAMLIAQLQDALK
ncbi:MAG: thioredoxin family protein [Anaerolinea sp.]|nr:thioredoxin family protein [Anaerolinea sp.]MCC6974532.1 thioredoxin family protein [Anaerolineae bacterium]CAG1003056.1 NADH dehydrogenase [Anaerolineae bacterium]